MIDKEIEELQMKEVEIKTDLKDLAKECLSIVDTSTLKDKEIFLFINAGILDMNRQGIDARNNIKNSLVQAGIVMFVKANFGMVDIKEKQLAENAYNTICHNLSLSSEYKIKEVDNNA